MRSLGFFIGLAVGWLGARLAGDQRIAEQQAEMQRAADLCRQSLANRTAELERLQAELARLQGELAALKAAAPSASETLSVRMPENLTPLPASDDLTIIEGIGPKIAALLVDHGISTFADLAVADAGRLRAILAGGGPRYRTANPGTWPQQAQLAAAGAWDDLTALQDRLKGGAER